MILICYFVVHRNYNVIKVIRLKYNDFKEKLIFLLIFFLKILQNRIKYNRINQDLFGDVI